MKNIEIFELPFSKCLSKLFCDSFKTASLSLSPFGKMVQVEEKSRKLNFQGFPSFQVYLTFLRFTYVNYKRIYKQHTNNNGYGGYNVQFCLHIYVHVHTNRHSHKKKQKTKNKQKKKQKKNKQTKHNDT